jgi:hypothetical protein
MQMNCRECPMAEAVASEGKIVLTCPALNGRPIGLMNTAKCELTWEDVPRQGGENECLEHIQNPFPPFNLP